MPIQRWRAPVALHVISAYYAALSGVVAVVFFPLWFGIPLAVLVSGFFLGTAIAGAWVIVNAEAGLVTMGMGPVVRRIRLSDVTAVLVDEHKISIARANGGEISYAMWGKGRLGRWFGFRDSASDIGHAISRAAALIQDKTAHEQAAQDAAAPGTGSTPPDVRPRARERTSAERRSLLAAILIGSAGVLALCAAFLVRLHWHDTVMTALAVIIALALGIFGVVYVIASLLLLLMRYYHPRFKRDKPLRRKGRVAASRG